MGPRVGLRGHRLGRQRAGAGDAADWTAFYADDPKTRRSACCSRRSAVRPRSSTRCARAAEAGKPVVVVKVGRARSAARNALAHSGAIVGSDAAFDALCQAYGVIRCADYGDWIEAPRGLRRGAPAARPAAGRASPTPAARASTPPTSPSARASRCAAAGDLAPALDADWAFHGAGESDRLLGRRRAVRDPAGASSRAAARAIPRSTACCSNIDQCSASSCTSATGSTSTPASWRRLSARRARSARSVSPRPPTRPITWWRPRRRAGFPVLIGAGPGCARWPPRRRSRRRSPRPASRPRSRPAGGGAMQPLPEYDSRRLLGLAGPREERAATPAEAAAAAARIGFPVVVKSDGPAHKERVGGVVLGLGDDAGVRAAAERHRRPVLVARSCAAASRCCAAWCATRSVGPLVVCGVGGAWAEPLRETARARCWRRCRTPRPVGSCAMSRRSRAGWTTPASAAVARRWSRSAMPRRPIRGSPRSTSIPCASTVRRSDRAGRARRAEEEPR